MLKTIISLILITFSSVSMAKLNLGEREPLPERLIDGQETIGNYALYGTNGGFSVLDGREQDGKIVEINFLTSMIGMPVIKVIPAKKWSDIPEYNKNFGEETLRSNSIIYLLNCVEYIVRGYQIKWTSADLPTMLPIEPISINQLQGIEKTAADYLCKQLLSNQKPS